MYFSPVFNIYIYILFLLDKTGKVAATNYFDMWEGGKKLSSCLASAYESSISVMKYI